MRRASQTVPDLEGLEEVEVTCWATTAVMHALRYDYMAWRMQQEAASSAFTPVGWAGFRSVFRADAALDEVRKRMLVVSWAPSAAPAIVASGQRFGRAAWTLYMPLVVTFQGSETMRTETAGALVTVARHGDLPDGQMEIVAVGPADPA